MKNRFELLFLGTGTSHGVPMIGCDCPVCTSSDPRNKRTRASVLFTIGDKRLLIDTLTDFRDQMLRHKTPRIDAVIFTHSHADHIHGLDDIRVYSDRQGGPISCYAAPATARRLRDVFDYAFDRQRFIVGIPRLEMIEVNGAFDLFGVRITPVPVEHGVSEVTAIRVDDVAYASDCGGIPESSEPMLADLELLVLDALRFKPHPAHFSLAESLEVIERLKPRRALLTHISHWLDHESTNATLPDNVRMAYDGLRVSF